MISPASFAVAYALDWLIGDPAWWPHPVRWMGRLIEGGEKLLRPFARSNMSEVVAGSLLSIVIVAIFGAGSFALINGVRRWHPVAAAALTVYLATTMLATRSLLDEAREVRRFLLKGDLHSARDQVGRIVGRDTDELTEAEVTRATIETLAESASDGIIAPMFYLVIGGVPAALAYKAVNTLDSMIGHQDERYQFFGKCAARLDDIAGFIPARLSALLFVCAAWTCHLDWRASWRIMRRDGGKHQSPNSGRPEAAMAGALGVRLGGTNLYAGEAIDKPHLGEAHHRLDDQALRDALQLTAGVSLLMFLLGLSVRLVVSM